MQCPSHRKYQLRAVITTKSRRNLYLKQKNCAQTARRCLAAYAVCIIHVSAHGTESHQLARVCEHVRFVLRLTKGIALKLKLTKKTSHGVDSLYVTAFPHLFVNPRIPFGFSETTEQYLWTLRLLDASRPVVACTI